MDREEPKASPLAGPFPKGTFDQDRAIERWTNAGWTFLYWTEIPRMIAIMEGPCGEINFIDGNGWAWRGPTLSKSTAIPTEQWPPIK